MMRNTILALTGAAALITACDRTAAPPPSLDKRTAVALAPTEFEAVHAEMRTMLMSMHQIHLGLAAHDTALMLSAARASGLAAAEDPRLEPLLPAGFLRMGVETHTNFDKFAEAVRRGQPTDSLIAQLSRISAGCTGCHAMYHLTPR